MQAQTLQAEVRERRGKGPARQLRLRGLIPAVFYGKGLDPIPLTLKPEDLTRALTTDYRRNQLIELHIQPADGGEAVTHHALVRDLEVHPVTRKILHADFYRVEADQKVRTKVPFEIRGRSIGVQKGGKIRKLFRALPVEAVPSKVPAKIVLDVAPLDINATVNVEDLPLDEGVKVTYPPERRVLFVEFKERDVEKKADDGEAES